MKLKVHDKCPILSQKCLSLKSASSSIFTGFVFLATCLQATAATKPQNLEYNNLVSSVNYSETFSNLKLAQNDPITITGKVLDEAKLPLPGASVVLKKGNVSATTNASGEFSITIPEAGEGYWFSTLSVMKRRRFPLHRQKVLPFHCDHLRNR